MLRPNNHWGKKIRSDDLREFIDSDQSDPMSVLIEVEAPDPVVEFTPPPQSGNTRCNPLSISMSAAHHQDEETAIKQTQTVLQALQVEHRFLKGPRVFVANATPTQLRKITELPTVRSVIPNHVHKVSLPHPTPR